MGTSNGYGLMQSGSYVSSVSASDVVSMIFGIALIFLIVSLTALTVLIFIKMLKGRPLCRLGMPPHAPWMKDMGPGFGHEGSQKPDADETAAPEQTAPDFNKEKQDPVVDLSSAVVILNERFAKGEITEAEYQKMKEEMFS